LAFLRYWLALWIELGLLRYWLALLVFSKKLKLCKEFAQFATIVYRALQLSRFSKTVIPENKMKAPRRIAEPKGKSLPVSVDAERTD
jgi:hypothetical protein